VSRYRFIAVEKAQHSVAQLCRVLQVAPSVIHRDDWLFRDSIPVNQIRP
jgi:hypothetical protein